MTVVVGGMAEIRRSMPAAQRACGKSSFAVHAEQPASAATLAAPASPAALDGVLALQETEADTARDRRARRHGAALLDALAGVQLALLHDAGDRHALTRLQALAEYAADAADPRLAGIVAAIVLRARVELARRAPRQDEYPSVSDA